MRWRFAPLWTVSFFGSYRRLSEGRLGLSTDRAGFLVAGELKVGQVVVGGEAVGGPVGDLGTGRAHVDLWVAGPLGENAAGLGALSGLERPMRSPLPAVDRPSDHPFAQARTVAENSDPPPG